MIALDRSPESFSPQMNSTSFQLVIPRFDPKGHHMNKIDKGLQGDATYQKSKLYPFQFQRRKILKLVFFFPMFQLVTPGVGQFWPQRNHMNKIDKVHKEILNTKYQSSYPFSFREEEFWSWFSLFLCSHIFGYLVSQLYFFATLNKERNSSNLQLSRRLNGKMLVLGFLYSKSTPIVQQKKMRKNQHVKRLRFSLNTNKYKYPKNCPLKIACSQPWPQVFVPPPIQNSPFSIQ